MRELYVWHDVKVIALTLLILEYFCGLGRNCDIKYKTRNTTESYFQSRREKEEENKIAAASGELFENYDETLNWRGRNVLANSCV